MTPENFVYWLQGYAEINGGTPPTAQAWQMICDHLKLVLDKQTPDYAQPLRSFTPPPTALPPEPVFTPVRPWFETSAAPVEIQSASTVRSIRNPFKRGSHLTC